MKRIRFIGLCLVAMLAFNMTTVASASATEILFELPTGSNFPTSFTAKPGPAKIPAKIGIAAAPLTCSEGGSVPAGDGKIENAHLGLALISFKKCTTKVLGLTLPCSNAGTEEIRIDSTWHLGLAFPGDTRAILFLLSGGKFSFNCTSSAKFEVTGEVIGELIPNKDATMGPNSTALLRFEISGGSQKFKEFQLQLGGTLMAGIGFKASLNGGTPEPAPLESEGTGENFKDSAGKTIELDESLA